MAREVVFITGASRGIGAECARSLAADGLRLALCARSIDALKFLSQGITQDHAFISKEDILVFELDVTDEQAVAQAVRDTKEQLGSIDLLINNAGIFERGSYELVAEDFERMLQVNVAGVMNVLRYVVPIMKEQGSGQIINLSSRRGKIATPQSGAYSASKFAVSAISEALYKELAPLGIRVTALCPGWVRTQMAQQAGATLPAEEMIPCSDIVEIVKLLWRLSPQTVIKEVLIEPCQDAKS